MQPVTMRHGGALCFCLLALLAVGGVWAQSAVMRHQGGGPTLIQAPDGSWVQSVTLRGVALPGLAGLRHAFTRQGVEITCPSSLVFSVGMDSEKSSDDDGQGGRKHRAASATVAWSMRKRCGPLGSLHAPATTTATAGEGPGTCHVEAPAVGTTVLTVVQPPSPPGSMAGAGPDPCTLTVTPVFSSTLVATCLLGAYLLLHGQGLMRGRLAVALLNASTTVIPLVSALVSVALLASMAVLSTAMVEMVLKLIPYDLPKEMWGTTVVVIGVCAGLGVAGSILCACLAVRLRFITVAAAPWLAQLLGWALVCSNSELINFVVRAACILTVVMRYYRGGGNSSAAAAASNGAVDPRDAAAAAAAARAKGGSNKFKY